MAHELDFTQDGVGAMFSVGETPWHREGVVLDRPPATIAEALALSGLDWTVESRPVCFRLENGDYAEIPDRFAIIRSDREAPLGVVGKTYQPLQNRDALRIFEPLIDEGVATWETAGALREGRDIWALIRFNVDTPIVREVFGGDDKVIPFGLVTNNHSGNRCLILAETPIRVVCANTLGFALDRLGAGSDAGVPIRHTAAIEQRLVEAAHDLWGGIIARTEGCARQYRLLRQTYLDETLFRTLVLDAAIPLPDPTLARNDRHRAHAERARAKAEERRSRIRVLWETGKGHSGDHSAWEAYNAVVQATDHDGDLFPTRLENRTEALLTSTLGQVKQRVITNLIELALAA